MKAATKTISLISGLIILLGVILIIMGFAFGGRLNSEQFTEVTHEVIGEFTKAEVRSDFTNVIIKKSDNGKSYAVCDESEKIKYELKIDNGILKLTEIDNRKWYDHIGIYFSVRETVLYLTPAEYSSLAVEVSSGNIDFRDSGISFDYIHLEALSGNIKYSGSCEELSASASSGKINISNTQAKKLELTASSGSIEIFDTDATMIMAETSSGEICLENVKANDALSLTASSGSAELQNVVSENAIDILTSSGNISLYDCDGKKITLECSSGSIKATLLTGKAYDVRSSSGSISYPEDIFPEGGTLKARTSSGNIKIEVK